MADKSNFSSAGTEDEKTGSDGKQTEKRKSSGNDGPPTKKITMNIKPIQNTGSTKPMAFGIGKVKPATGIKLAINSQKPKESSISTSTTVVKKGLTVAQAFNSDSEDDEEEMPPEAKMRMKNVGRDTPTAAGPNSFGKGKLGFTNHHRLLEKEIEKQIKESGD